LTTPQLRIECRGMAKTKLILRSEIPAIVKMLGKKGARPFTVTLSTRKALLKKNRVTHEPTIGDFVRKIQKLNCFIFFNYSNSVNRQRIREDKDFDFKAKSNWFIHTKIKGLVAARTSPRALYLQLKVQKALETRYFVDGQEFPREKLANYLPLPQKRAGQGLERDVIVIEPSIDSIVSFECDGVFYVVTKEIPALPMGRRRIYTVEKPVFVRNYE
jgi:hypothetical protein